MRILFYHKSHMDEISSFRVHIIEVLNHLSMMGHTVIYVDGKHHFPLNPQKPQTSSPMSSHKSLWGKMKEFVLTSLFRGEARILFYFVEEIELFSLSLINIRRFRPDIIYRRHSLFFSGYILSRLFNIPYLEEINGILEDEYKLTKSGDKLSIWVIGRFERCTIKKPDKHIVVTSKLKDSLEKDYKIPNDKIAVVENGANTDLFKPMNILDAKKHLKLDVSCDFTCFIGELAHWQGIGLLILAMPFVLKECPNARALIVGSGTMKNELLELSRQLAISDKVIFCGRVPYENVPLYINASSICVVPKIPSRYGFSPLKLCEYMACSKPVIASRTSGFELLEEYDAGVLINPQDPKVFAQAIITLLRDSGLSQRMGENGRRYVLENRSWEHVANRVASIFSDTIKEHIKYKRRFLTKKYHRQ